jgi:hypothetical protein
MLKSEESTTEAVYPCRAMLEDYIDKKKDFAQTKAECGLV